MSEQLLSQLTPIEFEEAPAEPRELRLSRLYAAANKGAPEACWDQFTRLHHEFEQWAAPVRARLLGTQIAWSDEELRLAKEVHNTCNQLALVGYRIARALMERGQPWEERTRQAAARTLHLMAETLKWEACVAPRGAHDYRKPHQIMRTAMAAVEHLGSVTLPHVPQSAGSTIESLYFRVLLLARFAGGALNARQIEILDAWMWQWMRTIAAVAEAPPGSALRVDLDGSDGLRRGPREDEGPSLYLPQAAIEKAYRAVLAQFHQGHIVPASGLASTFRVEEYVAVLDLVQDGLKASRQPFAGRARRHPSGEEVELLIGMGEIGRPQAAPARPAATMALALEGDESPATPANALESALGDIYEAKRRKVRLNDESESGLGVEGTRTECAGVATGDAVAIRREPGQPMVLGVVARSAPVTASGAVVMGIRRLGVGVQEVEVTREPGSASPGKERLMFVVGADPGGRDDGFLVSERDYVQGDQFSATILGSTYFFRFNRARERGRGWLLAGFEVLAARRGAAEGGEAAAKPALALA